MLTMETPVWLSDQFDRIHSEACLPLPQGLRGYAAALSSQGPLGGLRGRGVGDYTSLNKPY